MNVLYILGPASAGFLAALLGHRMLREEAEAKAGKTRRFSTEGLASAFCIAAGTLTLALVGVILLRGDSPSIAPVAIGCLMLVLGINAHRRQRGAVGS